MKWWGGVLGALLCVPVLAGCGSCVDMGATDVTRVSVAAGVASPGRTVEVCVDQEQCVAQPIGPDGMTEVVTQHRRIDDLPDGGLGWGDLTPRLVTVRVDGLDRPRFGTFVPVLDDSAGNCAVPAVLELSLIADVGLVQTEVRGS